MNVSTAKSGCIARIALSLVLLVSAGAANAARFLYTGGHSLDGPRVAALGHTYAVFTPNDAGWAAALAGTYGPFSAIVVGEASNSYSLTVATSSAIAAYVGAGGRVIVASDHNGSVGFLNAIFGYSAVVHYGCRSNGLVAASLQLSAVGSSFAGGPTTVSNLSCTSAFTSASIPATSRNLYTGTDGGVATTLVFASGYGTGRLVWQGWDFFPRGTAGQQDDWYMVFDSSLKFTAASCTDQGFTGPRLTLCKQTCEVVQSPATQAGLIRLYTAIYRTAPFCSFVSPQRPPAAVVLSGGGFG